MMDDRQAVKVGDKVRLTRDDSFGAYKIGDVVEVKSAVDDGIYFDDNDGDERYAYGEMFEPIAVADSNGKEPRFKVGDRVRALESSFTDVVTEDTVYTVTGADDDKIEFINNEGRPDRWGAKYFSLVAPLTIQSGAFYRTRDGRKVGPMRYVGESDKFVWECGNGYYDNTGRAHYLEPSEDIVAEWADDPAATNADIFDELEDWMADNPLPVIDTPTTGFTVPLCAPEFGGGFKVGDRVNATYCVPTDNPGTIAKIDGDNVTVRWDNHYDGIRSRFHIDELRLVAEATSGKDDVEFGGYGEKIAAATGEESRLVAAMGRINEPLSTIADIVRRLEALEDKAKGGKIKIGGSVTLDAPAKVTGIDKHSVNIVLASGGSYALPLAALRAA